MFLCGRCHRHVREALCPFCGAVQKGTSVAGANAVRIGMKRSAVLAAAAVAAIGTGVGCGGSVETRPVPDDAAADVVAPVADYGIAIMGDSGTPPVRDAGSQPDSATTADAGAAADASGSGDAQDDDVFAPGADYGIAPLPDSGHP
jgi:hypothetical protein